MFLELLGLENAGAKTTSLAEMIRIAQSQDHRTLAANRFEAALGARVSEKFSAFLPKFEIEAVDSTGFPGASSGIGMTGLSGSPYRSGTSTDLVVTQTLWDFGKTGAEVEVAKSRVQTQKITELELKTFIAREVSNGYFKCVYAKSSLEYWEQFESQTRSIFNEVNRFINTGQKSIIERYLTKSQLDEYARKRVDAETSYRYAVQYLEYITQTASGGLDCPSLKAFDRPEVSVENRPEQNLTVKKIQAETQTSEALVSQVRRDYYPKLVGLGSVGFLSGSRLVNKQDYEVAVGLTFPLYEGGLTRAKENDFQNLKLQKDAELLAQEDEVSKINLTLNEHLEVEQNRIRSLIQEELEAKTAFRLAQTRYSNLQGSLVDLRETLKVFLMTQVELTQAKINAMRFTAEKAILNGQMEKLDRW